MNAVYVERVVDDQLLNEVWDILVAEAGASNDPDERDQFRYRHLDANHDAPREWRFQGKLGFGGKVRVLPDEDAIRVDCYPEDQTPERKRIIGVTNNKLRDVVRRYWNP